MARAHGVRAESILAGLSDPVPSRLANGFPRSPLKLVLRESTPRMELERSNAPVSPETTDEEPQPTRDHTENMLAQPGLRVTRKPRSDSDAPAERLELGDNEVPGDISSAAPFNVAGTLHAVAFA